MAGCVPDLPGGQEVGSCWLASSQTCSEWTSANLFPFQRFFFFSNMFMLVHVCRIHAEPKEAG